MQLNWLATASFGLEGVVKKELSSLHVNPKADLGCVRFTGTAQDAFKANLWLRTADRVLLIVGEQTVTSFEMLFDYVYSLPWEKFLPKDASFPVSGKCARSQLMSVRDCQAITKKAIAERLKKAYNVNWCQEGGSQYKIEVAFHKDVCRLTIDASGVALNRRGYRTWNGEAPLRETLAAALVLLSPYKKEMPLHDPCCGTGTILIEAAMIASNRAPGLNRSFDMENWHFVNRKAIQEAKEEAHDLFAPQDITHISGSDINDEALSLAKKHLVQAGFSNKVTFFQKDVKDLVLNETAPLFIVNPPYGERLADQKTCQLLYKDLHRLKDRHIGSKLCAIASNTNFERYYGARAQQKKRFYNGRLECEYMIF